MPRKYVIVKLYINAQVTPYNLSWTFDGQYFGSESCCVSNFFFLFLPQHYIVMISQSSI